MATPRARAVQALITSSNVVDRRHRIDGGVPGCRDDGKHLFLTAGLGDLDPHHRGLRHGGVGIEDLLHPERGDVLPQPGHPDVLQSPFEIFQRSTPERLGALAGLVTSGDARTVEAVAHSLKSSCGMLGLKAMQELCAQLEAQATHGGLEGSGRIVQRLEFEFARPRPWLRTERWTASTGRPEITA
jgi:HPt (histidine-containing phosphotransfer) domain-containing protein